MYVDSKSDIICNEYEFTCGFLNVYVYVLMGRVGGKEKRLEGGLVRLRLRCLCLCS